jgi:hypothetical protein
MFLVYFALIFSGVILFTSMAKLIFSDLKQYPQRPKKSGIQYAIKFQNEVTNYVVK